ncbi:hypothetical protein [Streptomyces mirabilis]
MQGTAPQSFMRFFAAGNPLTHTSDYTVSSGTVLTWGVTNDAHA